MLKKLILIIILFLFLPFVLASTIDVTQSVKTNEDLTITVTPDAEGVSKYYYIYHETGTGDVEKDIGAFPYPDDTGYTDETVLYKIPLDWVSGTYYVSVYTYSNDWIKGYFNLEKVVPIGPNKKAMPKYSNKEVFLISSQERTNVLQLISVTTWTGNENCNKGYETPGNVCVYPTLVFHEEVLEDFDADSIIYFLQKYSPSKVTVIKDTMGAIPAQLDNLLTTSPSFGAGLQPQNIQKISVFDYIHYWETFDTVVYVEDDYELALLASTYASLLNAPLIIEGKGMDVITMNPSETFGGRKVICVGSVSPDGSSCSEQYDLNSLRQKYKSKTNTNKVILVNHNDWVTYEDINFLPEKSSTPINELYTKTSLMAPILASAKHELILSTTEKFNFDNIVNFIKPWLSGKKYLTIIAAPNVIPNRVSSDQIYRALDQTEYADTGSDMYPDVAVGRIMGITSSDVSSNIARSLFYDRFSKTKNVKFLASSDNPYISKAKRWSSIFSSSGYNSIAVTSISPNEWKNQDLISYQGPGQTNWAGISSSNIPLLENSIIYIDAGKTCSSLDENSFGYQLIRQGALAIVCAVSESIKGNPIHAKTVSYIYSEGHDIGNAFKLAYDTNKENYMFTLIGDPTLNIKPIPRLTEPLVCLGKAEGEDCETDDDCCGGRRCLGGTCGCQKSYEKCWFDEECCIGYTCEAEGFLSSTCQPCKKKSEDCFWDTDCCEGFDCVWFKGCQQELPSKGSCNSRDGRCEKTSDCCGGALVCIGSLCKDCRGIGEPCWSNYDCCNRDCNWFTCKKPSSGGGCFVKDTKINTPNGFIAIDQLEEGDVIYSYSKEKNKVIEVKVKEKIVHDGINKGYHDYNQWKLLEVEFSNGVELKVTSNHAFITETNEWEMIEDINIGERFIYDNNGNPEFVSLLSKNILEEEPVVYNIITDDENHNYFANGILAHNGGGGK